MASTYNSYGCLVPLEDQWAVSGTEIKGWGEKGLRFSFFDKISGETVQRDPSRNIAYPFTYYIGDQPNQYPNELYGAKEEDVLQKAHFLNYNPPIAGTYSYKVFAPNWNSTLEVKVRVPPGYEFFGWYYVDDDCLKIYNEVTMDGVRYTSPLILKPTFTFKNYVEIIDSKTGHIRILDEPTGSSRFSDVPNYNIIVPVIKYIKRTVTFDSDGGSSVEPMVAEGGGSITLPTATKDGYILSGWYYKDSLGTLAFAGKAGATYIPQSDITLYAVWEGAPVTVSYDANGGQFLSGSDSRDISFNSPYGVFPTVENNGYKFDGWWTEREGGTKVFADSLVTIAEPHTLYARWIASTIKFTKFDENDESSTVANIGKLSLYSSDDNYKNPIATEVDGVLSFSGSSLPTYRVKCELNAEGDDRLWSILGVKLNDTYQSIYDFKTEDGGIADLKYYLKKKKLYSIDFEYDETYGEVKIIEPTEADFEGKYFEGRAVKIQATPSTGYYLSSVVIFNADTNLAVGDFENIKDNAFTISSIDYNLRVRCVFGRESYTIKAGIDEKSKIAIDDISVTIGDSNVDTAYFEEEVTLKANVKEGYYFSGWYDGDEVISTEATYEHTMGGNITLIAKAYVIAQFKIEYDYSDTSFTESCKLKINGNEVELPFTQNVVLGDSLSYELILGTLKEGSSELWKFEAWYDTNTDTPIPDSQNGAIEPTSNLAWTAKITDKIKERKLKINFVDDEGISSISVDESIVSISPDPKNIETSDNSISFIYEGTKETKIILADEIEVGDRSLSFLKVELNGDIYAEDNIFNLLVNSDEVVLTAYYAAGGTRTTSVDFTNNSDRTMGEIVINNISSETTSTPISVALARGEKINISARAKNGYKFVGWYRLESGIGDAYLLENDVELSVTTNRTLYAKFEKDPNAVYEWEGSNENKMMVWRSKTYMATNPFNPSACRVDTTGYPVASLSVEMFSSPQKAPTAIAKLTNVKSQDARRLPIRRMERYLQVAIRNDEEVDAILVGTSMGGLSV